MTARQVYEGVLIELNKIEAPSLLLEDFNYLFNKAISQYVNKKYNIYDVNQQTTDDVRVLKATAILPVALASAKYRGSFSSDAPVNSTAYEMVRAENALYGATYETALPLDYLHLLNCVCLFKVKKRFKCYNKGSYVQFNAKRLTADMWGQVINNFYMRPTYKRPYYYIHNVNINPDVATNPYEERIDRNQSIVEGGLKLSDIREDNVEYKEGTGETPSTYKWKAGASQSLKDRWGKTDDGAEAFYLQVSEWAERGIIFDWQVGLGTTDVLNTVTSTDSTALKDNAGSGEGYDVTYYDDNAGSNFPRTLNIGGVTVDNVERNTSARYGNTSSVRLEIRYGKDNSLFELVNVYVDYLKAPQNIRLTQEQLDLTEDTSQMMEFPDYVCQEIINELVKLVMENASDPRLQTNIPVNQTIANPAQE